MIRVFFSGGQSNATGWATNNDLGIYTAGVYPLPDEYSGTTSQIYIYKTSSDAFSNLNIYGNSSNAGYSFNGSQMNHLCMEYTFFHRLALQYPGDTIYNIKYSYGGYSISQLQSATQSTFTAGIAKLDALGNPYTVEGFLWYQGESDQDSVAEVTAYPAQMTTLINHCVSLSSTDLKVFIVRPCYRVGVKVAQDEWNDMIYDYVRNESGVTADNKVLFTTDDLDVPAPASTYTYVHLAGNGMFRLGTRFFNTYMNFGLSRNIKTIGGKILNVGGNYKSIKTNDLYTDETYTAQQAQLTEPAVVSPSWPV